MARIPVKQHQVPNLRSEIFYREFWIVGEWPLIVHAWSVKAKAEMLDKQLKQTRAGRDIRDPESDFQDSLYRLDNQSYGFPATSIKKAITDAADKDKNIPKTQVRRGLFLEADVMRTMPAKAGAICEVPLVRIYGPEPQMREDPVRLRSGGSTDLRYRGHFWPWAIKLRCRINLSVITEAALVHLVNDGGFGCGIGEWRPERDGQYGSFHAASTEEQAAWEAFAEGKGPVPEPISQVYRLQEAAE